MAECIEPTAIAMAKSMNMPIQMAASITGMLKLFVDHNDEAIRQALANGEAPNDVVRDLLAAFQRDVIPFLIKWNAEQDLDDDGIPMPKALPFPNDWPPASECEECGGMGYTIGFNGPQKVRYACETCAGGSK